MLAKLASRTWDAKKHKDHIGVLKAMAGMKQSDCFENKVPNPDWMEDALKEKFQHEPFRSLLLETEKERIAEVDGRSKSPWTDSYGNMMGILLMKIRDSI